MLRIVAQSQSGALKQACVRVCVPRQASAQHFNHAKAEFKWRNRRDTFMDFHEKFDVPGYRSHMLAATDPATVPSWLNIPKYFMFSAICCVCVRVCLSQL